MEEVEKLLDDIWEITGREYIIPEIEDYYNDLKEIEQLIVKYYDTERTND